MPNELGLRNVTFEVHDLQAILDRLAADGYHLVGGVGQYEGTWRLGGPVPAGTGPASSPGDRHRPDGPG